MARRSPASKPRPGVSGLKRICGSCNEPVENAEKHPVLNVWLCSSCMARLKANALARRNARNMANPETTELRRMMNSNRHAEPGGQ